jgi:hypothetical protein
MAFTILKHLSEISHAPTEPNGEISPWLTNLSDLAAQFFKKFPTVDMLGFLTYLKNMMKTDN